MTRQRPSNHRLPTPVGYVVVKDVAASWASYAQWDEGDVVGRWLHAAGATDEGYRTVELWESRERYDDHQTRQGDQLPAGLAVPPSTRGLVVLRLMTDDRARSQTPGPEHRTRSTRS